MDDSEALRAREGRPGLVARLSPHHLAITLVGIFVALLGIGVLLASFLLADLGADARTLTDRQIRFAVAIDAAALHAKAIANDERGFLLSGDEEFALQSDIRRGLALARFEDAIDASSGEHRAAVLDAQGGFDRWLAALEAEFDLYRSGEEEAAVDAALDQSRSLRREYEASLVRAQGLAQEGIRSAGDAVSSSSLLAIVVLVGYLLVAAAIGIALTGLFLLAARRATRAKGIAGAPDSRSGMQGT
jgi:methyl-accepting chemotaxis protein